MFDVLTALFTLMVGFYFLKLSKGRRLVNPAFLFVVSQTIMFYGSLPLLDLRLEVDRVHFFVMIAGVAFFILGTITANALSRTTANTTRQWYSRILSNIENGEGFNTMTLCILAFSVLVCIAYYSAIGYNLFLVGVGSFLSGSSSGDVTTMRLQTYAGDQYLAPGYVNQFKNILLPLLIGYLYARFFYLRKKQDLLIAAVLTPLSLIFILGTGQRSGLFIVTLMLVFFFNVLPGERIQRIVRKSNSVLIVTMTLIFLTSTMILGRSVTRVEQASDWLTVAGEGSRRILQDNQSVGVAGFRYVYQMPVCWGEEWLQRLSGLLPGKTGGSTLDNDVHAYLYGDSRGRAPVSLWGEVWLNFGVVGMLIIPLILGYLYQSVFISLIRGPKTLFRLLIYASVTVPMGIWVSAGPDFLADTGVITIVMLGMLGKFCSMAMRRRSHRPRTARPAPRGTFRQIQAHAQAQRSNGAADSRRLAPGGPAGGGPASSGAGGGSEIGNG